MPAGVMTPAFSSERPLWDQLASLASRRSGWLQSAESGDTILRLVRRLSLSCRSTPCVLGVDDWAIRRGRICGTVLVDLERRRVVDLLLPKMAR